MGRISKSVDTLETKCKNLSVLCEEGVINNDTFEEFIGDVKNSIHTTLDIKNKTNDGDIGLNTSIEDYKAEVNLTTVKIILALTIYYALSSKKTDTSKQINTSIVEDLFMMLSTIRKDMSAKNASIVDAITNKYKQNYMVHIDEFLECTQEKQNKKIYENDPKRLVEIIASQGGIDYWCASRGAYKKYAQQYNNNLSNRHAKLPDTLFVFGGCFIEKKSISCPTGYDTARVVEILGEHVVLYSKLGKGDVACAIVQAYIDKNHCLLTVDEVVDCIEKQERSVYISDPKEIAKVIESISGSDDIWFEDGSVYTRLAKKYNESLPKGSNKLVITLNALCGYFFKPKTVFNILGYHPLSKIHVGGVDETLFHLFSSGALAKKIYTKYKEHGEVLLTIEDIIPLVDVSH